MRWRSRSAAETRAAGAALARALGPDGGVVVLTGPLGAGKTVLAKGLGEGLGLDPERVASPTFVIAAEYETPAGPRFVHVDAYRVESAAELEAAGLLDWLERGVMVAVEWGERVAAALPGERLELRLEPSGGEARELSLTALGPAAEAVLARFQADRERSDPGDGGEPGGSAPGARDTRARRES